jgi:hypothetical protein
MTQNIAAYIEQVARYYWGDPKEKRGHELRWGTHGSKSVDLRKGTWFDFEANEGGGVIDMVRANEGAQLRSLPEIMEKQFGIARQVQQSIQPARYMSKAYDYIDEHGECVYQVVRYEPKTFRQRRPDGQGGWIWNIKDVTPVPYNLPGIMAADPSETIWVVEGEKCAQLLIKQGFTATTNHGGAKNWSPELNKWFKGRSVVVLPDADAAGTRHAEVVVSNLYPVAKAVKLVTIPGLSEKQDVYDWMVAGGTRERLAEIADATPVLFDAPDVQDNAPAEADVFAVYDVHYLRNMPPVEWLVDGWLTKHGFAVLYGEPGAGKSFIAIDMALSMAYGKAWHDCATQRGAVLYIAGEGVGGLGKRIKAWQAHHKLTADVPFYVLPTAVRFREPDDVERLLRTIDSLNTKFSAVFVDTVARALLGGDENSATDMGMFVDACEVVKRHCGCAVVAIHHSGKDAARGMRGSTALLGAVDTSVRVSKLESTVTMATEKQKDAEPADDMAFEMVSVALIDDTSVVMQAAKAPEKKARGVKLSEPQKIALQALRNLCVERGQNRVRVEDWHDAHREKTPDATRYKRRDARDALQQKRAIVIDGGYVWEYKDLEENVR